MQRKLEVVDGQRPARGTIPADLGPGAVDEWQGGGEGPSALVTAMDEPAAGTVRSLLLEIRRQSSAIGLMTRAIIRFTILASAFLLGILAVLLVIAAILYQYQHS